MYLLTSLSFTVPNVIAVKFFCWCMYRYAGPDTRYTYSIEHMYTRLSAPRTPVSFFREIRLISYFDSNITLMARHAHRAREAIDLPLALPAENGRSGPVRCLVNCPPSLPPTAHTGAEIRRDVQMFSTRMGE